MLEAQERVLNGEEEPAPPVTDAAPSSTNGKPEVRSYS